MKWNKITNENKNIVRAGNIKRAYKYIKSNRNRTEIIDIKIKKSHKSEFAMPLFGKKDSTKKSKRDSRDPDKPFSIDDKYYLKELLGT